jgi:hypothetical protein
MYITEIQLYGVFKLSNYLDFIKLISYECDESIIYTPKQVPLSGLPQRIAFMCSGDERFVNKIKNCCEIHFKTTVQVSTDGNRTDIIVKEPILKNMDESCQAFKEFFNYVNTKENISIFQLAQDIKEVDNTKYMMTNVGNHANVSKIEDLVEKLGGLPVTINIYVTNGNVVFGNATINNAVIDDEKTSAKNWIKNNPPKNREKRTEYYARYKVANNKFIAENSFAKVVPKICGCISLKSNGSTYWVYK